VTNYAFIDSQNLHQSIKALGWKIDMRRFRVYLKEKYGVSDAFLFLGLIPKFHGLYRQLGSGGYRLVLKPVSFLPNGGVKGNVDTEIVLHAIDQMPNYDQAVLVSGDGDFASLVRYLDDRKKLEMVLAPSPRSCSVLLEKAAGTKIRFLHEQQVKLKKKRTP